MSSRVKSKQKTLFSLLIGFLLALCIGLFFLFEPKPEEKKPAKIDLPSDRIDPQEVWMQKMEEHMLWLFIVGIIQ